MSPFSSSSVDSEHLVMRALLEHFNLAGVVSCMFTADGVENQVLAWCFCQIQRLIVQVPNVVHVVRQRTTGSAGQRDSLPLGHLLRRTELHLQI